MGCNELKHFNIEEKRSVNCTPKEPGFPSVSTMKNSYDHIHLLDEERKDQKSSGTCTQFYPAFKIKFAFI